jgi:hypothetical protein
MNQTDRANEIVAAFQRYLASNNTSEIDAFSLQELRSTDEQLGEKDISAAYRFAIRNKISDLKLKQTNKNECKIRAFNLLIGILIGFVISGLIGWLFST